MTTRDEGVRPVLLALSLLAASCLPGALTLDASGGDASSSAAPVGPDGRPLLPDGGAAPGGDASSSTDGSSGGASCATGSQACGDACVDLASDPQHCGGCGHDCLGGTCKAGACEPVLLADNQPGAWGVATDGVYVYWTTGVSGGQVMRCEPDRCGQTMFKLAQGQSTPQELVVRGGKAYWVNSGSGEVMSCATGGCNVAPTVLASGQTGAFGLAVDDARVYFTTDLDKGQVLTCPLAGCGGTPTVFASAQPWPMAIAVDATNVYWTNRNYDVANGGQIMRCAKTGCGAAPTVITGDQRPTYYFPLASDGQGTLYWGRDDGEIARCSANACTPTLFATLVSEPSRIVVDGAEVYWAKTSSGGTIAKCAVSGCATPTKLFQPYYPYGLTSDAKSLYFADESAGKIYRLAK